LSEPRTNPHNEAKVSIFHFLKSRETTLEKSKIQTTAPAQKSAITGKFKLLTAVKTYSYCPNKTRIKLPEIHGKIIAQIATAPHKKRYRQVGS
jgi:hypothetical protein